MSRTRIKMCGMRRRADIDAAIALGVDAIGLVFVPASKRTLSLDEGAALRAQLPPFVQVVALLMDSDAAAVRAVIEAVQPDLLQFHGAESAAFCRQFHRPYLKAVALGGVDARSRLVDSLTHYYDATALLIDGHAPGAMGGSGEVLDWSQLPRQSTLPLVLAGGLHPGNVAQAIAVARPYAVDVASGIEQSPGLKDAEKMRLFVAAVRAADAARSD